MKRLCEYPPARQALVVYSSKLNNSLIITKSMESSLPGDVAVRYTQPFWWVIPLVPGQSLMRLATKPERAHSGSANPDGLNSAVVKSVQTLGR